MLLAEQHLDMGVWGVWVAASHQSLTLSTASCANRQVQEGASLQSQTGPLACQGYGEKLCHSP